MSESMAGSETLPVAARQARAGPGVATEYPAAAGSAGLDKNLPLKLSNYELEPDFRPLFKITSSSVT